MDIQKTLFQLSDLYGPSGFEEPVTEAAKRLLSPLVNEIAVDRMGNLAGVRRCGKPGAKRLLLDAHLDEVGMVVTGVEKGFLQFARIKNGIDPRMLPAREVVVLTQPPMMGVVTCLPPHVQTAAQMSKAVPVDKMYIDCGLSDEQAKSLVPVGTPVAFYHTACALSGDAVSGKSMDDRACFTAILRALELLEGKPLDVDIYVLGSVQEETGMRGCTAGAFWTMPDYAVAIDVTHAATPDADPEETFKFGGGPTIGFGPSMNRKMSEAFTEIAASAKIEYQIEVMGGNTGTNGWATQVSREGVPTAVLSVPLKYMHSSCETVSLADIESTARLLAEFCLNSGRWM